MSALNGSKTYLGLALLAVGWLTEVLELDLGSEAQAALAAAALQVVGFFLTLIGAAHKQHKLRRAEGRRLPLWLGLLVCTLLLSPPPAVQAQDQLVNHLKVQTRLELPPGATVDGLEAEDLPAALWPFGPEAILHPAHGSTTYHLVRYVARPGATAAMGGDDGHDGKDPTRPKATLKAAIESLDMISGTKWVGTIYLGPGIFEEDPIGLTTPLGQGLRIIGCGTNPTTGTELRLKDSATSGEDFLTFHAAENVHHVLLEGLQINMMGNGRDAIRMGRGGFNSLLRDVFFKNVPRWAIYHFYRPVSLILNNVSGGFCGYGQGTQSQSVAFADVGGGAYHVTGLSYPWQAGQTVRIDGQNALPTGLALHTNYFLVDDGGSLHLSATVGGAPLAAASAGTGTLRLYGGDAIPDIATVTFTDVGGGAYHLANPLPRDWVAGDAVRVRATAAMPGGINGGVDYYLVDDGGDLRLSATLGGTPVAATSAGTGIVRLQDAYDPERHGGFFFLNNATATTLSSLSFDGIQLDACGVYPWFVDEATTTSTGMIAIMNVETEVPYYNLTFAHDALVGVRGSAGDGMTLLALDHVQAHTAGGGINGQKALVKQLDTGGGIKAMLSARQVHGAGAQYDYLFALADQSVRMDFEAAPFAAVGGPLLLHGGAGTDVLVRGGFGSATTGPALPRWQWTAAGTLQMGAGTAMPTDRLSVTAAGRLALRNLPTSDPGEPGALWSDAGTLKISP